MQITIRETPATLTVRGTIGDGPIVAAGRRSEARMQATSFEVLLLSMGFGGERHWMVNSLTLHGEKLKQDGTPGKAPGKLIFHRPLSADRVEGTPMWVRALADQCIPEQPVPTFSGSQHTIDSASAL